MPKLRVNTKFKRCRNEAAQVVTEDLSKNLVHLRVLRLGANARAKLGLNHMKNGFNIRPLMVVRQELLAIISEKFESASPQRTARRRVLARSILTPIRSAPVTLIGLKRDKRHGSNGVDGF